MNQPQFHDHFSDTAIDYARFRPRYPSSLFEYLASIVTEHNLAWDCATGTGQAAVALAKHFNQVIATDASKEQITNAEPNPRVQYKITSAEASGLDTNSTNLVTVAQALHWLDLTAFYNEVRRISKANGILAVWTYGKMKFNDPEIRSVLGHFYHDTVGTYWPPERDHVEKGYRTLQFPFDEIETPAFTIEAAMILEEMMGYVRTWSATQNFQKALGTDPLPDLARELEKVWGDPELPITVYWPVTLRVGKVHA